jgi:hypothetical protein
MEISSVFDSGETIKGEDLQGREFTLAISNVAVKKFDDGTRKLIIHFQNAKKALVCNKTNAEGIAYMYGTDTDGWIGREIVLYFDPMVIYAGKRVGGVRVKAPVRRGPVRPAPAQDQRVATTREGYELSTNIKHPNAPVQHVGPSADDGNGDLPRDEIPF